MATDKPIRLSDINLDDALSQSIEFSREPNSPFTDGYSISQEEAYFAQRGMINEDHPLYDRYIELLDRKERLERMQAEHSANRGADSLVKPDEASGIDALGRLVDDGDVMLVHTIEAYRMFLGRRREPGTDAVAIIGGRRIAAALRNLWMLTVNDNPYADWALIRHEHSMEDLHKLIVAESAKGEEMLGASRSKGISFAVLRSASPQSINLGFGSPYGYQVAALIADFDYFVRLSKTLERKSLMTDADVRKLIARVTRLIRGVWNSTERFSTWLSRPEVSSLSRLDYVASETNEGAAKRIEFATSVFGSVPALVYTTELAPSHSRRRIKITAEERRVLQEVGARLAALDQQEQEVADVDGEASVGNAQEAAAVD